jgi:hypothetical protein
MVWRRFWSASCLNSQRVRQDWTHRYRRKHFWLAACCGLGQSALHSKDGVVIHPAGSAGVKITQLAQFSRGLNVPAAKTH